MGEPRAPVQTSAASVRSGPGKASLFPRYGTERLQLLAARIPLAMTLFMLLNSLAAGLEYHYFPERAHILVLIYLADLAICTATVMAVRRAPQPALRAAVASTYSLLLCLAVYMAYTGQPRVNCVFASALVLCGLAVLYPWGWPWQLCAGAATFLGYAIVSASGAPAALPSLYRYFPLGAFTVITAAGAAVLERQRVATLDAAAALVASEANFRGIFENFPDVFYRTDLRGTIQLISPSVTRYGYRVDDLIGHSVLEFYGESPARHDEAMRILLATGALKDFEVTLHAKDGTRVPASVTDRLVFDGEGNPTHLEGILRDITERKRAEEAQRELGQQRADFLAMVTHDIKTPAAIIQGYVDLLSGIAGLPREADELIPPIVRSSRLLLELVNNYLQLSQIDAGATHVSQRAVRLDEVLVSACAEYAEQARQGGIQVDVDYGVAGPPTVLGDRLALQRVFANLVSNAIKVTPAGGRIRIHADHDGTAVVIRVSDSGPGLSPQEIALLFQRYRQTADGRSRGGTGIGLFIVKSLVEAHGGSVRVESEAGQGATFIVRLPPGEPS